MLRGHLRMFQSGLDCFNDFNADVQFSSSAFVFFYPCLIQKPLSM